MSSEEFRYKIKYLEDFLNDNLVSHAHKNCGKPIYFILSNEPPDTILNYVEVKNIEEAKKIAKFVNCDKTIIDKTSPFFSEYYLSVWVGQPKNI